MRGQATTSARGQAAAGSPRDSTYDIAIVAEGGNPASPAISGSFHLAAGQNVSLVAHLDATGGPTLSAFANKVSSAGWASRVAVRHAAAAPAVDAYLRQYIGWFPIERRLRDIENGQQAMATVWPGHAQARVTLAGMRKATVLGPANLNLASRKLYALYAIGSAADGTLEILQQALPLR